MEKGFDYFSQVEKKVVRSFVEELQNKMGDEIIKIILFGSKVKGDFNRESDIDIFVLVREKTPDIRDKADDIAADYIFDYDIPLSPVLYDLDEYDQNKLQRACDMFNFRIMYVVISKAIYFP
jgi:predicted nucleotidyltransferase